MKKRESLALICVFLIFVVFGGCSSSSNSGTTQVETDYHKGTDGIKMSFVKNAPPSTVYEGDKLEVAVQVENLGAYPDSSILDGRLFISGFDTAAINGRWQEGDSIPSDLQGRSVYNPSGGMDIMTYKDNDGVNVPLEGDKYSTTIMVTSCYKYQTVANPIVCIDPNPYEVESEEKVCSVDSAISVGSGQGGPVSVSRVEEQVTSDNVLFRIYIRNSGSGKTILKTNYNHCPFNLERDEVDKVMFEVRLPSNAHPDCTPSGSASDPVRLINGQGFIWCSFDLPSSGSAYETPLQITLDYVYSDTIQKDVQIVKMK